jgi:hypothetical protein
MSNIGTHAKDGEYYVMTGKKQPGERIDIPTTAYYCKTLTYARWVAKMGGNGSLIVRPDPSGRQGTVVSYVTGSGVPTNPGRKGQRIKR